jgi:RND superfamily putative drug exporter
VLALPLGSPDEGALPETRTERRAYDLIAAALRTRTNGPLIIAVDDRGIRASSSRFAPRSAPTPGIAAVAPAR